MSRITDEDRYVAAKVRQKRTEKGITRVELGKVLGVSFQQVQKYEIGQDRISVGAIVVISRHLEVPLCEFFPDSGGAIIDYSRQTQKYIREYLALGNGDRKIAENLVKQLGNCVRLTPPGAGACKGKG